MRLKLLSFVVFIVTQTNNSLASTENLKDFNNVADEVILREVKETEIIYNFQGCKPGMYSCDDERWCYTEEQYCDGRANCPDTSDEKYCLCSQLIPQEHRCDEIVDCPDASDELGCFGCEESDMKCESSLGNSMCVKQSELCDGFVHCADATDELYCVRLSLRQVEKEAYLEFRREGYLQLRRNDQWVPLCGNPEIDYTKEADGLCNILVGEDRLAEEDSFKFDALGESVESWAHLDANTRELSLNSSCPSSLVIYVTCANPVCISRDSQRRRREALKTTNFTSIPFGLHSRRKRDHAEGLRIVGGEDSLENKWAFLVGIVRDGQFICGGSIITSSWILSAGHCFVGYHRRVYEVQAGMLRRSSWSPFEQTAIVSNIVRHENYDSTHLFNDLALLKLQTPLQLNAWVRPVCLANNLNLNFGDSCVVAGWGNTAETGELADHLQEVYLPTLESCREHFANVDDEKVICAGFPEGKKDACQGDSGAPMMCRNSTGGWVQAGAVSYGRGCARPNEPGAYSSVSYYRSWIFSTMEKSVDKLPQSGPKTSCQGILCRLRVGACLPYHSICNGIVDCLDARDETMCHQHILDVHKPSDITIEAPPLTPAKQVGIPTIKTMIEVPTENEDDVQTITETPTEATYEDGDYYYYDYYDYDETPSEAHETSTKNATDVDVKIPQYGGYDGSFNGSNVLKKKDVHCYDDFRCDDVAQCVSWEKVCDGTRNCRDGTDEVGCTCLDRLLKYRKDLVCDGYYDCFDLTDELGCGICSEGGFVCAQSRQCILEEKVCDGNEDCTYGDDEIHCVGLLKEPGKLEFDRFGELKSQSEGVLVLRSGNEWTSLCIDSHLTESLGRQICTYLGYSRLHNLSYVESPIEVLSLERIERRTVDIQYKHVNHTRENNFHGALQNVQNARPTRSLANDIPVDLLSGYQDDGPRKVNQFLQMIQEETRRKREICRQVVVRCKSEACGKAPLYFTSSSTPVYLHGGTPWAGSIYVDGHYRCGATLILPSWVLSSKTCMYGVNLTVSFVSVVMGSWRSVGGPTRLWGSHEHDRRVVFMKTVAESDIIVLRLKKRMPKTDYINHLCLPSKGLENVDDKGKCAIAGEVKELSRISIGVDFTPIKCQDYKVCTEIEADGVPCMRSWSGVIACQFTEGENPTWVGVGMWAYQEPDDDCTQVTRHPLFTPDHLAGIRNIFENYKPTPDLEECDGDVCVTGVCYKPEDHCDAELSCPDLSDEPPNCSPPLILCQDNIEIGSCTCADGEVPCKDGVCIPLNQTCDGVPQCPDASDEVNCTCGRRLFESSPHRLCDGILDCTDGSDEAVCGCKPSTDYFRCYSSEDQPCIPQYQVCDGFFDCPQKEDEKHCVALSPAIVIEENVLGVPDVHPSGYLVIRLKGKWFTIFYSKWKCYMSHLVCLEIGYYQALYTVERRLNLEMLGRSASALAMDGSFDNYAFYPGLLEPSARDVDGIVYIRCSQDHGRQDFECVE